MIRDDPQAPEHGFESFFCWWICRKRRLDLIQALRWTYGGPPEHVKANLTPQELEFSKEYSRLLGKYMRSPELGGVGLDLTAVCLCCSKYLFEVLPKYIFSIASMFSCRTHCHLMTHTCKSVCWKITETLLSPAGQSNWNEGNPIGYLETRHMVSSWTESLSA